MRDPFLNFLLLLVIGIVAGVVFDRVAGPGVAGAAVHRPAQLDHERAG